MFDTHLHLASDDEEAYPRRPSHIGSSEWWRRPGFDAQGVSSMMGATGVRRGVAVQAVGLYGYDNRYVIDAARAHPESFTAVVAVDPDAADAVEQIGALGDGAAAPAGVVGVRFFGFTATSTWVGTPRADEILAEAARCGLTAVITVFVQHLPSLTPAIESAGGVVALDHCSFPSFAAGRIRGAEELFALADLHNVHLKVASGNFVSASEDGGDPAAMLEQLAEAFGPDRLVWGSDYPQVAQSGYGDLVQLARRASRNFGEVERAAFFDGNAERLFGPSSRSSSRSSGSTRSGGASPPE